MILCLLMLQIFSLCLIKKRREGERSEGGRESWEEGREGKEERGMVILKTDLDQGRKLPLMKETNTHLGILIVRDSKYFRYIHFKISLVLSPLWSLKQPSESSYYLYSNLTTKDLREVRAD